MSNSKALREAILKQAGWQEVRPGRWAPPKVKLSKNCWMRKFWMRNFQCAACGKRSKPEDANNLNCPFCGGGLTGGGQWD